jgi:hypothetical protein
MPCRNARRGADYPTNRKSVVIKLSLFAALTIGIIYFFSNPRPWNYYDYTFRSASALLSGSLSVDKPPSWLSETIPFEGHYYSEFSLGSVLTMVPFVLLQKLHVITECPASTIVGIIAGCTALLMLLFADRYEVSTFKKGMLVSSMLLGTCMWCNLAFGGTWQIDLGFAVLGQIGALYFTRTSAPFLAGASFALAFGNRTEIIVLVPVFFYLLGDWKKCSRFSIAPVILGVLTLLYNDLRFHSVLDFGYTKIPGMMQDPRYSHGMFSVYCIPANVHAMLIDPLWRVLNHYPYLLPTSFGGSILACSPFLVLLFRRGARDRRMKRAAWGALALLTILLWLHGGTGDWQFAYRYSMILLPWIFVLILESSRARVGILEAGLCGGSILLNAWACYLFLWTPFLSFP